MRILISHPMETGFRKDKKTGKLVAAHFIQNLNCSMNGMVIMRAQWGAGISRNPYLSFQYNGGKVGDILKLSWEDNTGLSDSVEAQIN